MNDRPSSPEYPRSEPEIIPPEHSRSRATRGNEKVFVYVDGEGRTHRVNMKAPGPLTAILVLLAVALVASLILAVVLGALVFIIPIAAIGLAGLIAFAYARRFWRRLRGS